MNQARRNQIRQALLFVASPFVFLAIWEALGRLGWIDVRFFPLPTAIAVHIVELLREGAFVIDILASLRRIGLGLLFGFPTGVVVGMAMGLSKWARAALGPLVAVSYPIPKSAILPLLLIIFGMGERTNVMVVAIGVFFLAVINTYAGVNQIPRIYFDVARVYRVRPWRRLTHIVLPAAFPAVFNGLRLAVGYALVLIVAAEMIAAPSGLGFRIWRSWETWVIQDLYASLAVISFIGVVMAVILDVVERKVIHWSRPD